MLEEQLEKELEKAKEPLEKANPPPIVYGSTRFCRNARPQFQRGLIDCLKNLRGPQRSAYFMRDNCIENAIGAIVVEMISTKGENSDTSSDTEESSDAQGLSTAETISAGKAGRAPAISSSAFRAFIYSAFRALSCNMVEGSCPGILAPELSGDP